VNQHSSTFQQILAPTVRIDWSQFEGTAAFRCTVGVAIPLLIGLVLRQPSVSAFGAVGAVSVGFGSFQGAYRSRAALMLTVAAAMAVAIFIGALAGHSNVATVAIASVTAFMSGLLIAVGPAAAFVGLQSSVAALIAAGFPSDVPGAASAAATAPARDTSQTLLVVTIWPLRRFSVERHTIATAYRTLGAYAVNLPAASDVAPEPHTFATLAPPLQDPQPFARPSDVLVFQALFDEAERIRASLAAIVSWQRRTRSDPSCRASLPQACGRALLEIAAALDEARDPADPGGEIWRTIDTCADALPTSPEIEALLGQIRAAWRTSSMLTSSTARPAMPSRLAPLRAVPPIGDALTTLRANLSLESAACRHALRLTVAVGIATAIYRGMHLPRGYWMPLTALLVLRPDFHETFARGAARMAGTILGGGVATLLVTELHPGPTGLTLLVLMFVWTCYATFRVNYTIFTIAITGYVVFILMLSGVGEMTAVTLRAVDTIAGGCIALVIYAVWPTWAAGSVRSALASMFEAQSVYVSLLLMAYADPTAVDLARLTRLRAAARRARSNAEAIVERMLVEPNRRAAIHPRAATGLLAAIRRNALAALALHAGVERGIATPSPTVAPLAEAIKNSLSILAEAVGQGRAPRPLPSLRQTHVAVAGKISPLLEHETDLMVDAINTMAEHLARDVRDPTHESEIPDQKSR